MKGEKENSMAGAYVWFIGQNHGCIQPRVKAKLINHQADALCAAAADHFVGF